MKKISPHYITVAGKQLPLIARKLARARNMVVRYDAKKECVKVTMPRYVSLAKGLAFAQSKDAWIAKQLDHKRGVTLENGAIISLFGEEVRLVHVGGRGIVTRVEISKDSAVTEQGAERKKYELYITGDEQFFVRRVRDFIKKEMQILCEERARFHAQKIGVTVTEITLRDTSSRWGSCSRDGKLMLCWRLAFASSQVLDYVICHEVAHLKHHNHSAKFWAVVAELCPEFEVWEAWLRVRGKEL